MSEETSEPDRKSEPGEAFKREGPTPATEDTGRTVDEMNRKAEQSIVRNIRPENPSS